MMTQEQRTRNRIVIILLSLLVVVVLSIADKLGHASDYVGSLNGVPYDDFEDLIDDIEDYEYYYMTIEMYKDWDADFDSDFNCLMEIGSNKSVVFNMNGHMFNRGISYDDYERNGELIYLGSGSTLTINGGDTSISHTVYVHTSTDTGSYGTSRRTAYGGTLAGGSSSNSAGGIQIQGSSTVTLNNVTIAGCRAEQNWQSDGFGGGIAVNSGNTNLTLNNSTITGCFAYNDGGGIYFANSNNSRLDLNNSHIDSNYAARHGGGICIDGEYIYVTGDGKTTVSDNKCSTYGGGIYIWNDDTSVSGLILKNNEASIGGGVATLETNVYLTNLVIEGNTASRGAGIHISHDYNSISSCTVTGNKGVGVWVESDVDEGFKITGTTVIKSNTDSNLYLSAGNWSNNRVLFDLYKGSEVWICYYDGYHDTIMVTPGKESDTIKSVDCTKYLFSDQSGYYFGFDANNNMRKIMRYYGNRPTPPAPTYLNPGDINDATKPGGSKTKAGIVGTVGAGGGSGSDYNLLRGFYHYQDGETVGEDSTTAFYYSDGLFFSDPAVYNNHLGTLSLAFATSSKYLQANEPERGGNVHYNKHAGIRQFMADIGVKDGDIYLNDSYVSIPETDSIGVMIGHKPLLRSNGSDTGSILVPVAIRSGGYEAEWAGNMNIGKSSETEYGEHKGFAIAAGITFSEIYKYLEDRGFM